MKKRIAGENSDTAPLVCGSLEGAQAPLLNIKSLVTSRLLSPAFPVKREVLREISRRERTTNAVSVLASLDSAAPHSPRPVTTAPETN